MLYALALVGVLSIRRVAAQPEFSPVPLITTSFIDPNSIAASLQGRQGDVHIRQAVCAASYTACTNLNKADICCQPDTVCTTDNAARVACCPKGAVCTGTLGGNGVAVSTGTPATSSGQIAGGGTGDIPSTYTVTVTAGYSAPDTAGAGGGQAQATPTGTIPNAPYPFAYIPHTFANAAQCTSYVAGCQNTFSSCTAALGGGSGAGAGVTIAGPGITTANGANGGNAASAASACSSLSSQACFGLQTSQCASFGTVNAAPGKRGIGSLRVGAGLLCGILGVGMA